MKPFLFCISLLIGFTPAFSQINTLDHLLTVNTQWKNQAFDPNLVSQVDIEKNNTFNDWIATHLMLVESTLRNRNTAHLSKNQIQNRTKLLADLNQYWHNRPFPVNDYLPYKNPVFIDRTGNHCAVGYLMQQSGYESLAQQIDKEQKFAYVHEIKTPGVAEWANENGFSLDELAWIQPGYPPNFNCTNMAGGLNAAVNAIAIDPNTGTIYAGGDFTANNDGIACNHIAVYLSGFAGWLWTDLGQGLNGNVHSLLFNNNKLYVGGEFTSAGGQTANHIAVYDLQTSQWSALGNLDGTVKTLCFYEGELFAGGSFTGMLAKWNGTQWQEVNQGFLYGTEVRALETVDTLLYIGGDFELATGALRRNVVAYWNGQFEISGMGTATPVNDFEFYNGKLYAACTYTQNTDTCALAVFENYDWSVTLPLPSNVLPMTYFEGSIKKLLSTPNGLLCAGQFQCSSGMTYGNNLMNFQVTANDTFLSPLLVIDTTIQAMALGANNRLCFGGEFVASYSNVLNHIAEIDILTGIQTNHSPNTQLSLYPNPTCDFITLTASSNMDSYRLFDLQGRILASAAIQGLQQTIPVKNLAPGIYSIQINFTNTTESVQFVKEN
jgi:hypothetical protein